MTGVLIHYEGDLWKAPEINKSVDRCYGCCLLGATCPTVRGDLICSTNDTPASGLIRGDTEAEAEAKYITVRTRRKLGVKEVDDEET